MSQLEYLVALVSIIVALALADLMGSFRELVRPRREVRWHWLPVTWTAIVLLLVVQFWWVSAKVLQGDVFGHAVAFLPYLGVALLLYLACAFALPDPECRPECAPERLVGDKPAEGAASPEAGPLDLEAFYFSSSHRRWFFGNLIALFLLAGATSLVAALFEGQARADAVVMTANPTGAVLVGVLVATERKAVHAAFTTLTLGVVIYVLMAKLPVLT